MSQNIQFKITLDDILSKDISKTISKIKEFESELEKANQKTLKLNKSIKPDLRTVDGLNQRLVRLTSLRDKAFNTERIKSFNREIVNTQRQVDKIKFSGMGIGGRVNQIASSVGMGGIPLGGLAIAGAGIAITGMALGKAFSSAVKASDLIADVRKSTGMNESEGVGLIQNLSRRDTRTNIADQMSIAKIGGQIGVGKNEIESFVAVMDKAVVSLSDEFTGGAEEVTRALGSIKNLYKETKSMSASDAMTKIGDTINYLGATGTATGPVVAEFVTRMGQLGGLKGTFREMAGLGAAFQEMGLTADIASGGISNVMLTIGEMTKDGANLDKFAKLMKISSKDATALFNKNPTKFLSQFAESLKGMDNTTIARTMQALKIGTQESIKAMQVMASDTDFFAKRMTESAGEIGSLQKEFEIKNNTLAGSVDKLGNSWDNFFLVLGNKQSGWMKSFIDVLTDGVNFLANENVSIGQKKKAEKNTLISNAIKKDSEFVKDSAFITKGKGGSFKDAYFSNIDLLKKEAEKQLSDGRKKALDMKAITSGTGGRNDLEKGWIADANILIATAKSRIANLDKLKTDFETKKEIENGKKGVEKRFRGAGGERSKKMASDFIGAVENAKPSNYYITIQKIETNQNFSNQMGNSNMAFDLNFKRKMKEGVAQVMVEVVNDIKLHLKS